MTGAVNQPRNNRCRVVFLAADLSSGGGVNKVIRDLAHIFEERLGFAVTVVNARSNAAPEFPFSPGIEVQHHRPGGLIPYLRLLYRLRLTRPDVVIGPWAQDNVLLILAFLCSSTKVVAVEHTSWNFHRRLIRLLTRLAYPLAWRVVVLNPGDFEHYSRYLRGRVRLIPNPISDRHVEYKREKLILAVGHLERVKNFEHAIMGMAKSGLEKADWSLVIIGRGSEEANLKKLMVRLGLRRTRIEEPTADIGSWYARASILMLTSRVEGFPLVLAEAMRSGVLPVAYAIEGASFILRDFPDHLVPFGDVTGLADRLVRFAGVRDPAPLRQRLATSIGKRFSPSVTAERWRELLEGS